ncbi:MAG: GDP-mannose 4,6-dehydratase [Acidiferrobacterales bacterium]|nr:GDP-mannose 4,6-dehydratase [Acidiferrobacterales bacterium]
MRALICGITGQDGAYLAQYLLNLGYEVFGISRTHSSKTAVNLLQLGIANDVTIFNTELTESSALRRYVDQVRADEIYNLSGQSSVSHSFFSPAETLESLTIGNLNLLEILRTGHPNAKYFHASSGECFGDTGLEPATELTAFSPQSPYAIAKASSHWMVKNYRDSYGLFACSGIMFIHESPLRSAEFVTKKVCRAAAEIAAGISHQLVLGNLSVRRDWGWAPEYVEGIWKILQTDMPEDLVLCTGRAYSLEELVQQAFIEAGLESKNHVVTSSKLMRPKDAQYSLGCAARAKQRIDWNPQYAMPEIVKLLVNEEMSKLQSPHSNL